MGVAGSIELEQLSRATHFPPFGPFRYPNPRPCITAIQYPLLPCFSFALALSVLGSTLSWICEAADKHKVKLSRQALSHWASYVYKGAIEDSLNFEQTKYLAHAVIDVIRPNDEVNASCV